jgi:hypothetical protein
LCRGAGHIKDSIIMTIKKPVLPPRAASVDSVSPLAATGQPETEIRTSDSRKPAEGLTRRAALAGVATAAALPIAGAIPAPVATSADAELIELGARFEPLLDQYYLAHPRWSGALARANDEQDQEFGTPAERDYKYSPEMAAASEARHARLGVDEASDALSAPYEEMGRLANAINAAPVASIEGLRVKALIAFWEIAPLVAGDTEFSFDDAYPFQQLFTAVAEVCGLTEKIRATGYQLPDIGVAYDDCDEDYDDEGEDA